MIFLSFSGSTHIYILKRKPCCGSLISLEWDKYIQVESACSLIVASPLIHILNAVTYLIIKCYKACDRSFQKY